MSDELEITDGDREAAASVAVLAEMRELILSGRADHHAEPWARRRMAGYQAAIADVVGWLGSVGKGADEILPKGGIVARRFSSEITRRFGKGA